jgi:hypothetical protein
LSKHEGGLPPEDFDAAAILRRQKSALAQFPEAVVQAHLRQLGLPAEVSASEQALHALVLDLYRRLDALVGATDQRRTDPLSYYEKNVSPVLQLLQRQRSLNAMRPPVEIDLRDDFLGYNWHPAEVAHGSSSWRWMAGGPQSGIMIPAMPGMRMVRLVGRSSVSVQDSELVIRLNGRVLRILSDHKKEGNLHINLEVPAEFLTDTQMSTFPWYVLHFEVKTHAQPNARDPRSLGYGICQLEILGEAHG